jgi:predicted phage baseplate assembly protein
MSLPLPRLDDRRWADLVEQGRALVPLYSPEWTDHNATDPGITLMELLAWVAEGDIYQLNRITARQKRRMLHLLGIRPDPPRPAALICELRISGAPASLPASLQFSGQALDSQPILFTSTKPVTVSALDLRAVQRRDANGYQNLTAAWTRQDVLAAFGDDPSARSELYLGFEQPLPSNVWTTLYFVVSGAQAAPAERRRILDAVRRPSSVSTPALPPHHDARVVWECLADSGGVTQWLPLEADDDTRSLTLSGSVRVRTGGALRAQAIGQVARPLYYVRGRLASGALDEAPRLERIFVNGLEMVQSSAVSQTWSVAAGAIVWGTPTPGQTVGLYFEMTAGAISKLTVNTTPGDAQPQFLILGYVAPTSAKPGTLTFQAAFAGTANGEPEQIVTIGPRPIVESSFRLFSLEGQAWRTWTRVDDFAASTRAAAHFMLDTTSGDVTFGDGEHGRTPLAGSLLVAQYDATLAEAGIGRVISIADSPLNRVLLPDFGVVSRITVSNQSSLEAGAAAETLSHAIGRAIESREASLRAVTAADFETLARETPGTRIARVAVRPNLYPGLDCVSAPGIVTVVVVPSLPADRPSPSSGLVRVVTSRLERRRTIGTRVIVAGPSYLEVAIRASVKAFDGTDKARLSRDVSDALDAYFHPLHGGPDGTGWPLGRDVFRAEVMQVIDETPGVDHVRSLELVVEGCEATCGNVCLRPQSLVASDAHQVEVL